MPATDRHTRRNLMLSAAGVIVLGLGIWIYLATRLPPQIGNDDGVFNTVDALFTAITSHDTQRIDDCERRLRFYREGGELSLDAFESLKSMIEQARAGQWEPSAKRLYDFMRGQRRKP